MEDELKGVTVSKVFPGHSRFTGTVHCVAAAECVEGAPRCRAYWIDVQYTDGDWEQLDEVELALPLGGEASCRTFKEVLLPSLKLFWPTASGLPGEIIVWCVSGVRQ